MSPRPGGAADKLGNHYEGAWAVSQLLEVLAGRAESITVEPLGEIGAGVEFTHRRRHVVEAHQVKRQRGDANYWSLADLRIEGVLESARRHVAAGREFNFVSTIPAQELQGLAELARNSPDLATFVATLAREKIEKRFDYLVTKVYSSAQTAWETLRGTWAHWPGERQVRNFNSALAGLLVTGAPAPAAAVVLGDLITESLSEVLTHDLIAARLDRYELALATTVRSVKDLAQATDAIFTSWKSSVERELLSPMIHRPEADDIGQLLIDGERCMFVVGNSGTGKSAVLLGAVDRLVADEWPVLALRLDREAPFSSTIELGRRIGLDTSPVSALGGVAGDQPSLLLIDQLDAVSKASGRMPGTFDAIADLVHEAAAFPNMRVLLACRKFDLDNDDRIRTLIKDRGSHQSDLSGLSDEQVAAAVAEMGIPADQLTQQQYELLRLPLHLKLLATIADQRDSFTFATTKELFDAYWDRKRRDCNERRGSTVRFAEVIGALADEMSAQQRLTAPVSAMDEGDLLTDADILASEHVLVRDGQQFAFFHETFFDYAFARRWTRRNQTLVEFLLAGEQELFRRTQVRQILSYIREESASRSVTELEQLLTEPRVRFHVKDVAIGLLRGLQAPSTAEWQMVERLLTQSLTFTERIWGALATPAWFDRLDTEGAIEAQLDGASQDDLRRTLWIMASVAKERPDRLAEILSAHAGKSDQYIDWLLHIARFADVHDSRPLFDLLLNAVRSGELSGRDHQVFMFVHELGKRQPLWAIELLRAHLVERPDAMALDASNRVSALLSREYGLIGLVTDAAEGAPISFCEVAVPYIIDVLALTAYDQEDGPSADPHFFHRDFDRPYHEVEQALLAGTVEALRTFVDQDPIGAMPLLERLAGEPYEIAQWLVYEALAQAGETHAEYAAGLLADRTFGLYATNATGSIRKLLKAIGPHLSGDSFAKLERSIMEIRPSWEGRVRGRLSFVLLSAIDESRLSAAGRTRLGELRRRFNAEQPADPEPPLAGHLGPPIPQDAARHMTDNQWLRAIEKHGADTEDWNTLTGGAVEQSRVLLEEAKQDPERFAQFALRLQRQHHPSYAQAILQGLGDTEVPVDAGPVFDAMRHVAGLDEPDNDRWLGWPMRRHLKVDIPADIIALLLGRALHSPDPSKESWLEQAGSGQAYYRGDPLENGINTARGQLVEALGDILVYDRDGTRTALVAPALPELAADPSVAVRACTAHLIAACLRHARSQALDAFHELIQTDDRLLATRFAERLLVYVGNDDVGLVSPVIERMIASGDEKVREGGGRLATYAGLELEADGLLALARTSPDTHVRQGAAEVCAGRLPHTANAGEARALVVEFANDADAEVRKAVAAVASALRDRTIRPFASELLAVIDSPAFPDAVSQLLITLENAPDRVNDLVLATARRFVDLYGTDASDMSTRASADAREVGSLLLRAYAQANSRDDRSAVLDLLDRLLEAGAYGVAEMVDLAER